MVSRSCASANVCKYALKKTGLVCRPEAALASRRSLRLIEPDFFQDVLNSGEMVVEDFARHVEELEDGPVWRRIVDIRPFFARDDDRNPQRVRQGLEEFRFEVAQLLPHRTPQDLDDRRI